MSINDRLRSMALIGAIAAILGLILGATIFGPQTAGAQETPGPAVPDDGPPAPQIERIRGALDGLVADGTISGEQADAVAAHLASQWDFRGRRLHRIHAGLDVAAATIGITEADLVEALGDGQTIAEVAEENGVDAQTVIDDLVAEVNSRVDEAVANGDLDAERAAEIKANAVERITDFVNGELHLRRRAA
ncbi:MAG TPA: hypothetical protein VJ796_05420 [Acidimicrobiia bacterium]|nr:hypothetical protein [Acidimicrobiia bacterium]